MLKKQLLPKLVFTPKGRKREACHQETVLGDRPVILKSAITRKSKRVINVRLRQGRRDLPGPGV